MELMIAVLYIAVKWLVYSLWCSFGMYLGKPSDRPTIRRALNFGGIRVALGLPFGLVILFVATKMLAGAPRFLGPWYELTKDIWAYMGSYIPVHWFEWSILGVLMAVGRFSVRNLLLGSNKRNIYWRLAGIAVSLIADIPILIAFGGLIPPFC